MPEPTIVDLDELVPDDVQFRYRGKTYLLPGDPPNDVVLELLKHYERMFRDVIAEVEGDQADESKEAVEADIAAAVESVKGVLLALFQLNDPELTEWPFGMYSTQNIVQTVLLRLGLLKLVDQGEDGDPPTTPTPKRRAPRPKSGS